MARQRKSTSHEAYVTNRCAYLLGAPGGLPLELGHPHARLGDVDGGGIRRGNVLEGEVGGALVVFEEERERGGLAGDPALRRGPCGITAYTKVSGREVINDSCCRNGRRSRAGCVGLGFG